MNGQVIKRILALQRHLIRHVSNKRIKIETTLGLRLLLHLLRWRALQWDHSSEWLLSVPLSILVQLILIVMVRILHEWLLLSLVGGLLKWEEVIEGLLRLLLGLLLLRWLLVEGDELDGDAFLGLGLGQVGELFGLADGQQIKLAGQVFRLR